MLISSFNFISDGLYNTIDWEDVTVDKLTGLWKWHCFKIKHEMIIWCKIDIHKSMSLLSSKFVSFIAYIKI